MGMDMKERVRSEEPEEGKKKAHELDLSGMSLDSLPNPPINLGLITKLDLSNNNLESIPESLTARLLNLEVLDVHSNQLRSLPNSVGCLAKLKALNVSSNLIQALPRTIEDCKALQELIANFNKLTQLPETLGFELHNLQKLAVNSNKLSHLPSSTSHMTSLRVLDARLNCLRALPDGLENLLRLQVLSVSQNFHHLHSIPYALGLLSSLVELDVSYNSISHLPVSLSCLTKLRSLQAEGNPLVSPPPHVLEHGIDAVRDYLGARMNGPKEGGSDPNAAVRKKGSWIKKLVKCGTFGGVISGRAVVGFESGEGLLMSDYRSIDGLASPRYVGIFSPRRLFSPRRPSPRR